MTKSKKSNRRSTAIIILVAGGIFLISAALIPLLMSSGGKTQASAAPIIQPVTSNYPAPQLALTDLQGKAVSLDDYQGKVILVNNWATWCPPCKLELPELQAYYAAHGGEDFALIGVESGDSADQVASIVSQYGMTYPVWLDPDIAALEAFQNWNLPSSYVIDRDGTVRYSWTGGINQSTLEYYVTPLLEDGK